MFGSEDLRETIGSEPCPECEGRGWIVSADGGNGTARPCACRFRERVPRLLAASGLPARYKNCRLDNFQVANSQPGVALQLRKALFECRRYVDEFVDSEGHFRETGLILVGPPGVGKTHLAAAVLRELVERYKAHGRFVEFTELVAQMQ